jgi:hypothetical protein
LRREERFLAYLLIREVYLGVVILTSSLSIQELEKLAKYMFWAEKDEPPQ